jgi:MoxR-like ATPase
VPDVLPATAPDAPPVDDVAALHELAQARERIVGQLRERIAGQDPVIELLLVTLFAGGHALFVGVPGLAKTLLVASLAQCMDLQFSRIQFTPDLMPSDVTGSEVLEEDPASGRRTFRFVPGPVFCNLLLADEINRTPPKTQAALLQAMQERKVTAGGHTHALVPPFHVFATQNPIEQEGTYPLPEAQLDRFAVQIRVGYPDAAAERKIVAMGPEHERPLTPVLHPEELLRHQQLVRRIPVAGPVVDAVVELLRASRPEDPSCPPALRELLQWGAGPRAGQQLVAVARARAAIRGRAAVTIADVRAVAPAVLEHRLVRSFAAEARGVAADEVVARLMETLPS